MKPITITLEKGKDPNAPLTSIYVRKSAFDGEAVPKRIVLTVHEET